MKTPSTKKILTDKQENFAITYVTNGGDASDAYRKCYDVGEDTKETTIWVNAHKLLHTTKVSQRIDELRSQKFSGKILTLEQRKVILSELAEAGDTKAVDLLNKMDGVYIEKKEVEHKGQIVHRNIIVNPTKGK